MKPRMGIVWPVCALLAGVVLAEVWLLGVRLRPYWVAKYHGRGADLHGAMLVWAPLRDADLDGTNLRGANLRGADLRGAFLDGADLTRSDLRGADLRDTNLEINLMQVIFVDQSNGRQAKLHEFRRGINLWHARYDARTRWPAGFDPQRHGAVKVK